MIASNIQWINNHAGLRRQYSPLREFLISPRMLLAEVVAAAAEAVNGGAIALLAQAGSSLS